MGLDLKILQSTLSYVQYKNTEQGPKLQKLYKL